MSVESNIQLSDFWFRGEDKTIEFTVFQADGTTAQDITGWALQFELCDLADPPVSQFIKTTVSGIVITDAANGVLEVTILDTDTDPLAPGKFQYELRRTDAGLEAVLAHGTAQIQRACT